ILFKAPDWLYSGFIGLIALIAIYEYFGIAKHYQENIYLHWYAVEVAIGIYFLGHCLHRLSAFGVHDFGNRFQAFSSDLTGYRVLPLLLLLLGLSFRDLRQTLPTAAISYMGFLYIGVTLGAISWAGHYEAGRMLVFVFLLVVWSGDIFAYYVGRAIGRHKLAEHISPKKTWEGAIASTVGAVIVSVVLFHYLHYIGNLLVKLDSLPSRSVMHEDAPFLAPPWWMAAVFGLCVNVAAQLGDLVESAIKRGAGVKDSGTLLPGHGGILDRIDATIFAAPVLWFFGPLLYKAIIRP
ncbi:MAG TPA: phosphatidate cytidylyltransferase, partial [Candidatus Angelobacter sp.]|nr:phosphatidate cytidylyltransferase [Candidatus Angelobacter sp.]